MAKQTIKKYIKVFKNLFNQYSNSLTPGQAAPTFDNVGANKSQITAAEIIKMQRDLSIGPHKITKDEVIRLIRLINT